MDLGKFDSRLFECIIIAYSSRTKDFRCYNKALCKIVETTNVKMDDSRPQKEK